MALFPVALELFDQLVLVVGAGNVARRKIQRLLDAGARVRVVSPSACEEVAQLASSGKVEWVCRNYDHADGVSYCLVFAMTNDSCLNEEIADRVRVAGGFCDTATSSSKRTMRSLAQGSVGSLLIAATSNPPDPLFSRMIVREMSRMLLAQGMESVSFEHGYLRESLVLEGGSSEEMVRDMLKVDLSFFRETPDISKRLALYGQWFGQRVSDRVRLCVLKRGEES